MFTIVVFHPTVGSVSINETIYSFAELDAKIKTQVEGAILKTLYEMMKEQRLLSTQLKLDFGKANAIQSKNFESN